MTNTCVGGSKEKRQIMFILNVFIRKWEMLKYWLILNIYKLNNKKLLLFNIYKLNEMENVTKTE